MKNAPIRVLIADGDPLVCRALARLVRNSAAVEVIATSADRNEALALAGQLHPAVALVDAHTARLDGMDGMDVTRALSHRFPATRVISLGVYETMRDQALLAGACRFLLKDCSGDTLVEAIRLAASGQCEAQGTPAEHTADRHTGPSPEPPQLAVSECDARVNRHETAPTGCSGPVKSNPRIQHER